MATAFELALFERQLQEVLSLPEACRWIIERDASVPLGVFATMHSLKSPNELFKARLRWTDFFKAPSLKFVDMETGAENDPKAWPRCFGFRPGSLDACLPWTEEGQRLHPEWQRSAATAFPKVDVPLQFALLNVQSSLDTSFAGRGP